MSATNQIKFHAMCIKEKPHTAWYHIKGIMRAIKQMHVADAQFNFTLLVTITMALLAMQVWVTASILAISK